MLRQRKQVATRRMISGESNKSVQGDDMTLTIPGMAIDTRETATASRMFVLGGCIGAVRNTRVFNSEVFTRLATVCNLLLETGHGTRLLVTTPMESTHANPIEVSSKQL